MRASYPRRHFNCSLPNSFILGWGGGNLSVEMLEKSKLAAVAGAVRFFPNGIRTFSPSVKSSLITWPLSMHPLPLRRAGGYELTTVKNGKGLGHRVPHTWRYLSEPNLLHIP